MKTFAPFSTVFALMGISLITLAFAGPMEEADAADKRSDYVTAIDLISPLAKQGDVVAQRRMGIIYASGKGVPADYSEAEKWFQKAAAQGDLDAIWNIGFIHHRGRGNFQKDFLEGEKWYLRAAERGHLTSQNALALAYFSGDGVERDYSVAAKWYLRAANQGNSIAQLMLGMMYENGQGVPQDRVLAYKWQNIAAAHASPKKPNATNYLDRMSQALDVMNHKGAVEMRDRLYQEMTQAERAEAQKLTREWRAKPER
jgi:TPR repeat protein